MASSGFKVVELRPEQVRETAVRLAVIMRNWYPEDIRRVNELMVMRRGELNNMGVEGQLHVVQIQAALDPDFDSVMDCRRVRPIHEIASFGSEQVQLRILRMKRTFDTEHYASTWGTPLDVLANYGSVRVQRAILRFPRAELVAMRGDRESLLHKLAERITVDDPAHLLELPVGLLGLKMQKDDNESVIRRMYDSAHAHMKKRIYSKYPSWNRF